MALGHRVGMTRVLVLYGTAEGHTEDVVKTMIEAIAAGGHQVDLRAVENAPAEPRGYSGVVVGSSIHMGQHHKDVVQWAATNHAALTELPSAFFQVSLSSAPAADPKQRSEATTYVDGFIDKTGWHPDLVGLFGGALLYTRYGFAKRQLLKSIAKKGGLGTNTHRDYDYTDYDAVRHFGDDVAHLVTRRE